MLPRDTEDEENEDEEEEEEEEEEKEGAAAEGMRVAVALAPSWASCGGEMGGVDAEADTRQLKMDPVKGRKGGVGTSKSAREWAGTFNRAAAAEAVVEVAEGSGGADTTTVVECTIVSGCCTVM